MHPPFAGQPPLPPPFAAQQPMSSPFASRKGWGAFNDDAQPEVQGCSSVGSKVAAKGLTSLPDRERDSERDSPTSFS